MAGAEGTGLTPWATLAVQDLRAPWPAVFQASELLRADPKKMNPRVEKWCPGPRAEFSTLVPGSKPPRALFGLTVLTQGWTDTPQVHQLALCSASTFGSRPHRGHRQKRKSQVTWQMGHSVRILKWAKFLQCVQLLGPRARDSFWMSLGKHGILLPKFLRHALRKVSKMGADTFFQAGNGDEHAGPEDVFQDMGFVSE